MPFALHALAFVFITTRLSNFDLAIVALYLVSITLFGLRFREKKKPGAPPQSKSLKSYFLANNTIPWWAIALSIVSAETSTLTIISIPGVAFAGDFGFLQLVIGYMLGRIVVAALFLPRYFAGEMFTAYQLIDRRFGPFLHKVTAGLFLLTRAAAEGVRVFAVSIVVGIAIGTGDVLSIAIISALTLLYTFEGGMTAVIWTDVVQMMLYVGGTIVALFTLGSHVPGGWTAIHTAGAAAGKFHMLNFALNLSTTYTFWAGVLGGTFLTMASHGTDQLMVQRLLAARNLRESRLALLSSGAVIFLQFAFFLLIGVGLYVFYGPHSGATFRSNDYIFPTFIVREMPIGIAGLLVAAILAAAMSNLSAALNSLSSTTVVDFYMRFRPHADDRERNLISKSSTVLWALVLFAIAIYSIHTGGKGHVVEVGLSIASVAYGCLLGVFLLGTLTKFANQWGTAIGMVCGFALNVAIWQFPGKVLWHFVFLDRAGINRSPMPNITIPHIAYPWYTIIGAAVTFAIGALCSLFFKQSRRTHAATAALSISAVILSGALALSASAQTQHMPARPSPGAPFMAQSHRAMSGVAQTPAQPDFTPADTLILDAIAAHKLPGAVLLVGHNGRVVYHRAYGNRKLANEPGLDGKPSPAEPMTEDTIFDMASLTKCLATATSVMQLYDARKLKSFDDPIETYLPDFNADHDATRARVTVRMLLTHFSGEAPDVSLKDPWGLAAPDRAEGFHRALTTPLAGTPGAKFVYSDINFILLGLLVEKLSGQREDIYAREHIYAPLGMTETRYLPFDKACDPYQRIGAAIIPLPEGLANACRADNWSTRLITRIAPTTHDDEGKSAPETNPHYDMLTRGTVHDPTTRRMGGVAGHAGLFSTAHDVSLYAQALLDKLLHNSGPFPVSQSTLRIMTEPKQPGWNLQQLNAANDATRTAGASPTDPLLAASYPAIKGQDLRGFGWDIDTAFSKPRGRIFPIGSFGHTGFTGTTLWIDPSSETYYVLLSNAVHPRGNTPISNLRGEVATAVANALGVISSSEIAALPINSGPGPQLTKPVVQTGIDVLESSHFSQFTALAAHHEGHLSLGLLTNQSGIDAARRRTVDVLAIDLPKALPYAKLTTLFSPEHGIFGAQDSSHINAEVDPATGVHVTSLYGPKDSDKRPSHDQLKDLDAVVIDLQDAGVHFWTYESALGYFLEASAAEERTYHHRLDIVVLDRPNLVATDVFQGPVVDVDHESYVAYMPVPTRHGLTFGELARYINQNKLLADGKKLDAPLTIIRMTGYNRRMFFADTGLPWVNPSPNLKSPTAATLYPGIGLIEFANISVGRGTATPFEQFGAGIPAKDAKTGEQKPAWFVANDVAAALTARHIPGVTFAPIKLAIAEDANHYPFHGQTIEAVHLTVTDRAALDTPELGIEILAALHKLYPTQLNLAREITLVANQPTMDALARGDDARDIARSWQPALDTYKAARARILLYP